jgi:hypothetical protein
MDMIKWKELQANRYASILDQVDAGKVARYTGPVMIVIQRCCDLCGKYRVATLLNHAGPVDEYNENTCAVEYLDRGTLIDWMISTNWAVSVWAIDGQRSTDSI